MNDKWKICVWYIDILITKTNVVYIWITSTSIKKNILKVEIIYCNSFSTRDILYAIRFHFTSNSLWWNCLCFQETHSILLTFHFIYIIILTHYTLCSYTNNVIFQATESGIVLMCYRELIKLSFNRNIAFLH